MHIHSFLPAALTAALTVALTAAFPLTEAAASQFYRWKNVRIGGGGGFVPGIVFNPSKSGLAYARTDIGGAYRLNADDTWKPLTDWANTANWHDWGIDALATDPIDTNRLYLAVGMYTDSSDPNKGEILRSTDQGSTWDRTTLPFKVGGNMPGRGIGERLVVDPNKNNILYFGARSGNGLWKSTDYGATWEKVTKFTAVSTYVEDSSNGYTADITGLAWITFDTTSGSSGTATPRIFVGVVDKGNSVFVSNDAGATWSPVPKQPTGYLPHKGKFSPKEKTLYITYSDQDGPYNGAKGSVYKYNVASGAWTDISPVNIHDIYYGFGGLALDAQKPGTLMVASLNSWYPDAIIFRSTDSGATWSRIWDFKGQDMVKHYTYDVSAAPWLQDPTDTSSNKKEIGWMIESLEIDPFDSNDWLYGTGATIFGGHDLLKWDTDHNVSVKSLATGIEETSVQGLISPPGSGAPPLLSAVGDIGGFYHSSLDTPPQHSFDNPNYPSTLDIDYAGNKPSNIVRVGSDSKSSDKQVALSTDYGKSWAQHHGASSGMHGGKVAISADGDTILWATSGSGVQVSRSTNEFVAVPSIPSGAVIASDKRKNSIFYASSGSSFYVSTNNGVSFESTVSLGGTVARRIVVNPTVSGDVWVSTDAGLFHSTDSGSSFSKIGSGVTSGWSFALGAKKTSSTYHPLYGFFTINDATGLYRSDDQGVYVSWTRIDDADHGFGAAASNVVSGDANTYGRVYVGTNGRGIFYRDTSCSATSEKAIGSSR